VSKYKKIDLIVLQFADNNCYMQIRNVSVAIAKHGNTFSVNLNKGTWKYDGEELEIGRSRYVDRHSKYGVIGVYDRNNDNHLDRMVNASNEAIRPEGNYIFSD
jgi:hypothetical protein